MLTNQIETEFFELEEAYEAEQLTQRTHSQVYSWKTVGRSNWLERGLSISDVLGLVVLSIDLPDSLDMPDDPEVDSDDIWD